MPSDGTRGLRSQWSRVRAARGDLRAARAYAEQLLGTVDALAREADGQRAHAFELGERVTTLTAQVQALTAQIEGVSAARDAADERLLRAVRMTRDDDARCWSQLWELRRGDEYARAFDEPEPLVTIIITTYRNWPLLRDRAIPSVIAQTYENWNCLVVGDAAPPEAAEAVAAFDDDRLRFVNLPYRGPYPPEPRDAWLVSGTSAFNLGLATAPGRWIGSVGDDDALVPHYVESLLALARRERAEVPYGQLRFKLPDAEDLIKGTSPPTYGTWGTQCALFHGCLRFMPLLHSDWVFGVPHDWSWAERMMRIGVRFAMLPEPMVDYFPSQAWRDRQPAE